MAKNFDIRQTNIAKGLAIIFLLFHHLFSSNNEELLFKPLIFVENGTVPFIFSVSELCSVCVSMFLFLSGYGLFKSYEKYLSKYACSKKRTILNVFLFVKNHLIKLLADFWIVYIIFVPLGLFFGKNFYEVYSHKLIHLVIDFFGLSYLQGGYFNYTMNVTWWYMSVAIVFYIIFPLLYKFSKLSAESVFMFLIILSFTTSLNTYAVRIVPFYFGMYVAEHNLLFSAQKLFDKKLKTISFSILSIIAFVILRKILSITVDFLGASFNIIICFLILSKIPVLNRCLEELGKYSGLIFMFHTFIISYYFQSFTYYFKYSFIILPVSLIVCYIIARIITWLKHITRYDRLVAKLTAPPKIKNN